MGNISEETINWVKSIAADAWRQVDENGESPVNYNYHLDTYLKVKEIQDRQIRKDSIYLFLKDKDLLLGVKDVGYPIHRHRLYEPFRQWLRRNGYPDMGKDMFCRMIGYSLPIVDEDIVQVSLKIMELIPNLQLSKDKEVEVSL